ncbi:MAG: hypothetical protein CBC53_003645 [Alphaproteobacteria bacterium TMED93]|nr:MAG: hypothetical protein CBC53_003645 [Alphaproteobacteria bacterium TMED93]|tara:strand:- start:289 stop:573 length:285 start_codon:yes stop_codon:yes gene_type:complete
MNKIKEIDLKIKELKNKNKKILSSNNKINPKFYSMAMNISIELITGIGLGVFLGLLVDNYLQTKPLMFIIFFIVGTIVGFYNMYKSLKKYGYFK